MPRIEQINAGVGLEPARQPNIQLDTSIYSAGQAMGNAIKGVGSALGQVASRAFELEDQRQKFDMATLDDERRQKLATALQQSQQNMPVAGRDFHKTYMEQVAAINAEYAGKMRGVNPKVAQQYEQRWSSGETEEWSRRAAGIEHKAGSDYYRGVLGSKVDEMLTAIKAAPDGKLTDAQLARFKGEFLANAPYLSPAEKAEIEKNATNQALFVETVNRFKTKKEAEAALGVAPTGTQATGAPATIEAAKAAIARVESQGSGGYAAIGPVTKNGDRAYGKYQVMGNNIPSWTREALGQSMTPAQFAASPEAQDKVFEHRFGGYLKKYGNMQDAASMWFSGRPYAGNNSSDGYNSVKQYVDKVMAGMGGKPGQQAAPSGGDPRYASMPFAMREQAIARVAQNERSAMAEVRASVARIEQDANAAFLVGRTDFQGAPTQAQFIQAYGPEEGGRRYQTMEANRQTGMAIGMYQTMKQSDIAQDIANAQLGVKPGPGFVENAQRVAVRQRAANEVIKRRNEDPVTETIKHIPGANAAYQNLSAAIQSNDPRAIREAARVWSGVALESQKELGIDAPQIVPKAYAEAVSGNIRKLAGEGKLQDAHAQLLQQMDMWGDQWKTVQEQLVKAGLPGVVMVASSMNRPDQRQAAELLMQGVAVGKKEFEKVLGDGAMKEIREASEKTNLSLDRTFAHMPNSQGTSLAIKESVETLAMVYARQGDTPAKAAERAYQDIIGKKYHKIAGETYRIPIERDRVKVEAGMNNALAKLGDFDVDVPPSDLRGLQQEDIRKQYVSAIRANHRWLTNGDESGMMMVDQRGRPVTVGGKPLKFTWTMLEARGSQAAVVKGVPDVNKPDNLPLMDSSGFLNAPPSYYTR